MQRVLRALLHLFRHGIVHRDLKASNLLVQQPTDKGALRIVFIDLDGARRPLRLTPSVRHRDLSRLAASLQSPRAQGLGIEAEHWRGLLEGYLQVAQCPELELDALIETTTHWATQHNERNLARGRPVT